MLWFVLFTVNPFAWGATGDEGKPTIVATNPTALPVSPERLRQALVEVRAQNKTVALGMVLDGDGRIVTALGALGRGVGLTARYADGTTALLRVIHTDRAWDLALLSPSDQRFTNGLLASKRDPFKEVGKLRILRLDAARKLNAVALGTPLRETLTGSDSAPLTQAMTFRPALQPNDVGAPIVDEHGDVVGIAAQACLPTTLDHCVPMVYAVPVAELKRFIRDGASFKNAPLPWLGITVASESSSAVPAARIMSIGPNSPASALALRAGKQGDILLAVDGTPVGSPEQFAETLHRHRAGDRVTLLLLAEGRYREVRVTLGRYPEVPRPRVTGQEQPDLGY
ncbi:MAG TPA: S1C family serine protease [Polyangiaceae bacterium]|nr:S1C family serine protease [Polyangiaceae bacterium]